jgi:hypothetical protein
MAMKKFKDDYELVETIDEKGRSKRKAVYRGDYFEVSLDAGGLLRFKRYCLLLLGVVVVLHVIGGFINNAGMYQFYVALPYAASFFPLFYAAEAVLRLPKEKRPYRRDEIGLSFDRIKSTSRILFIFLVIGVFGNIIYLLFFSAAGQRMLEFLFLLLEALAAAAVYFLIKLQKGIVVNNATNELSK